MAFSDVTIAHKQPLAFISMQMHVLGSNKCLCPSKAFAGEAGILSCPGS